MVVVDVEKNEENEEVRDEREDDEDDDKGKEENDSAREGDTEKKERVAMDDGTVEGTVMKHKFFRVTAKERSEKARGPQEFRILFVLFNNRNGRIKSINPLFTRY
jgi:hypothetical protein